MLYMREKLTSRAHRRGALSWLILLSLALHLISIGSLLMLSSKSRVPDEAEALSVEFVTEPRGAAPQAWVPAEASPASIASAAPAQHSFYPREASQTD